MKNVLLYVVLFACILHSTYAQVTDKTGFFIWDEATSDAVIEDAIARGVNTFRSRDIAILSIQSAWNVFKKYGSQLDVMVAIPINYTYTTTPVDMSKIADSINQNPFIRRLQIYPKLQPGLMNPSELNPCQDWLTGYGQEFEQRIRQVDQLVTDKSVEIVIAGQLGTPGCADLTRIVNTLYDLQSTGRKVAWAVTVYPYYYGTQDASLQTLTSDINEVLVNLAKLAPAGKATLPLRVIETGWPDQCSIKATAANHCTFAQSAFDYSKEGVKLYYFELQDFPDGWSECEKHFGLYNAQGIIKCDQIVTSVERPETLDDKLIVYPVPGFGGFITIQCQACISIDKVQLYSVLGVSVPAIISQGENNQLLLDVRTVQKGIYTLVLQQGDIQVVRKIILE